MNPWALLTVVLVWGASVGGAFYFGRTTGQDNCIAEAARDEAVATIASDAAASATAKAIAGIKVRNVTNFQEVRHEITERPVYRDPLCRHSDEQLRRINEALTGQPEPAGRGLVPRADAASGAGLR